jgi:hypothetical protein
MGRRIFPCAKEERSGKNGEGQTGPKNRVKQQSWNKLNNQNKNQNKVKLETLEQNQNTAKPEHSKTRNIK